MSYNLLLNSSNVIGTNNNQYKYNFINGGLTVPEGAVMSISQVTLPYSWYNISSAYGNNTFSYTIPTNLTNTSTVTVTIPDGFYTISSLNTILQNSLLANNFYFYSTAN